MEYVRKLIDIKKIVTSAGRVKKVKFILRVASFVYMAFIVQLLEVVRIRMFQVRSQWNGSHLLLKSRRLESLELA